VKLQRERQVSSIVVTHDVQSAKVFSDRMLFMKKGTVVAEGTFDELQDSGESFVAEFLKECS